MIWNTRRECEWHNWFAWYPVCLTNSGGKKAWLETVGRRYAGAGNWEYVALR